MLRKADYESRMMDASAEYFNVSRELKLQQIHLLDVRIDRLQDKIDRHRFPSVMSIILILITVGLWLPVWSVHYVVWKLAHINLENQMKVMVKKREQLEADLYEVPLEKRKNSFRI